MPKRSQAAQTVQLMAIALVGFGILFVAGVIPQICAGPVVYGVCIGVAVNFWLGLGLIGLGFVTFTTTIRTVV